MDSCFKCNRLVWIPSLGKDNVNDLPKGYRYVFKRETGKNIVCICRKCKGEEREKGG